jgi:cytochrome c-type biogenesis protein CcmE
MKRTTIKIALSVAVIGGSLAYLLTTSMSEAVEYYHPADVVIQKPDELVGQRIRVGGTVLKGSIAQKTGTLEYQFEVRPTPGEAKDPTALGKSLTVRYTGVVPDTFKDDAPVVVTGVLGNDHVFGAKDLTAKCPSKYEAGEKNTGSY